MHYLERPHLQGSQFNMYPTRDRLPWPAHSPPHLCSPPGNVQQCSRRCSDWHRASQHFWSWLHLVQCFCCPLKHCWVGQLCRRSVLLLQHFFPGHTWIGVSAGARNRMAHKCHFFKNQVLNFHIWFHVFCFWACIHNFPLSWFGISSMSTALE